jgi:UDP-N-acetylmuramyl pentapeptide phosphotransferase/UDP-N-acetylglucosamine-1-phosphate transferase
MSPIRRTISLVVGLAMLVIGFGFTAYLLLLAPWWEGWMIMASGLVGTVGLYDDFIDATPNKAE